MGKEKTMTLVSFILGYGHEQSLNTLRSMLQAFFLIRGFIQL